MMISVLMMVMAVMAVIVMAVIVMAVMVMAVSTEQSCRLSTGLACFYVQRASSVPAHECEGPVNSSMGNTGTVPGPLSAPDKCRLLLYVFQNQLSTGPCAKL